jgi:hypothetical protein
MVQVQLVEDRPPKQIKLAGREMLSIDFSTSTKTHLEQAITLIEPWLETILETPIHLPEIKDYRFQRFDFIGEQGKLATLVMEKIGNTLELRFVRPILGNLGFELSRVRIMAGAGQNQILLQTYIESELRPVNFTPETLDIHTFLRLCLESPDLGLSFEGVIQGIEPHRLQSPEGNLISRYARTDGKVPVVLVRDDISDEVISEISGSLYGLAHFLIIPANSLLVQNNERFTDSVVVVFWRDGRRQPSFFQISGEKQVLLHSLQFRRRSDISFERDWALAKSSQLRKMAFGTHPRLPAEPLEESETQHLMEALANSHANEIRARQDLELFIETFDSMRQRYENFWISQAKRNERILAQRTTSALEIQEFLPRIELQKDSDIKRACESLSNATHGALIFTENAFDSWRKDLSDIMNFSLFEDQLIRLCQFAITFNRNKGNFGTKRETYAWENLKLKIVPADPKMPEPTFWYEGEIVSQEPHLKADTKLEHSQYWGRIHFGYFERDWVIVVNHIGHKTYESDKS